MAITHKKINRDIYTEKSISESKKNPFGIRPQWAKLLPYYLAKEGYINIFSGKWHIDGDPYDNDFNFSYQLKDHDRYFNPKFHTEHGIRLEPIQRDENYYSTVEITSNALSYINEYYEKKIQIPFFLYIAYTAPHFPLQALEEDINAYEGKYKKGWDEIRTQRYENQKKLGIIKSSLSEIDRTEKPPYIFEDAYRSLGNSEINQALSWNSLNDEQKNFQQKKMEIYAAMINRIDKEIGRLIFDLNKKKLLNDTIIIFLSDNGSSSEIMIRGDGHSKNADYGSRDSFLSLGPGWSSVANTPFKKHKTWVHEGGISTPFIVNWGNNISDKGQLRMERGHVIDIVPTILELVNIDYSNIQNKEGLPQFDGISLAKNILSNKNVTESRDLWFHHDGNKALISGSYKLVKEKNSTWELYNIEIDRAETNNLDHLGKLRKDLIVKYNNITEFILSFEK